MRKRCYSLQVNLFDMKYINAMPQVFGKARARKFSIQSRYADLEGMRRYFNSASEFNSYKKKLLGTLQDFDFRQRYDYVGSASMDKLYELETLCIGSYAKNYVLIVDFSQSLDYFLHRIYKCNMKDIRKIQDYDLISSTILNCRFDKVNQQMTFGRLMEASPEFLNGVLQLSATARKDYQLGSNTQVHKMAYDFYRKILEVVDSIKSYVSMVLCSSPEICKGGDKGVIRSLSYSSVVLTVDNRYDGEVLLHQLSGEFEDYKIIVRSYAPYEYLGEVLRNESTWRF